AAVVHTWRPFSCFLQVSESYCTSKWGVWYLPGATKVSQTGPWLPVLGWSCTSHPMVPACYACFFLPAVPMSFVGVKFNRQESPVCFTAFTSDHLSASQHKKKQVSKSRLRGIAPMPNR
ncbi:unnamed protein product, partial [Discosporangium mesarthrocarpum]